MRNLFGDVAEQLRVFTEQRNRAALICKSDPMEAGIILQALQSLEASSPDFLFIFTDDFAEANDYAGNLLRNCQARRAAICKALMKEGLPEWPPIPDKVADPHCSPPGRLRELISFFRDLLPDHESRLIWALVPLNIKDPDGFAAFVRELIRSAGWPPWYRQVRFVFRDDADQVRLAEVFARDERVQLYTPSLSMDSLEKGIHSEAANETRPLEDRMQNLVMLAAMDFGKQRLPAAIEKYQLLYSYYLPTGNKTMAAFCLNEIGKCFEVMGNTAQAKLHYEASLPLAAATKTPPILLSTSMNLANLSLTERRWEDAEQYCDSVAQLAQVFLMPPLRCEYLEKRGIAQHEQGNTNAAVTSWEEGMTLARKTPGIEPQRKGLLRRLRDQYAKEGAGSKLKLLDEELAALEGAR